MYIHNVQKTVHMHCTYMYIHACIHVHVQCYILTSGAGTISPPPRKEAVGVAKSATLADFDLCCASGTLSRMSDLVTCVGRDAALDACFLVVGGTDEVIGATGDGDVAKVTEGDARLGWVGWAGLGFI